jgi:hypothetical protein
MPAQIRFKALAPLASLVLTVLVAGSLAACGDSSSEPSKASPAERHAAAEKIIAQATGVNPAARSARIDATIGLDVKGFKHFEGPIEITANGFYNLPDGEDVPELDMDVSLALNGGVFGGGIVVAGEKGYITLGSTGYKLPDAISKVLVAPAREAKNGLTKTGAMFYINPQDWQTNARVIGEETVAGEPTVKLTADVLVNVALSDLAKLFHFLTLIHVTRAVGLPTEITPKMRAAFLRSVKDVQGVVWMGKDDHVLRKAHVTGKLVVAKENRKTLLGARSGSLDATVNISEVGDPHKISAPSQLDPYANLQLSLKALAEAAGIKAKKDAR